MSGLEGLHCIAHRLIFYFSVKQAKKFVEGVPQVVKEDVSKEEAQKLKTTLEAAGGSVQLD